MTKSKIHFKNKEIDENAVIKSVEIFLWNFCQPVYPLKRFPFVVWILFCSVTSIIVAVTLICSMKLATKKEIKDFPEIFEKNEFEINSINVDSTEILIQ